MKAFAQARAACLPRLYDPTALAVTLPWLNVEAQRTRDLMGPNPWPYGIEANRATIETPLRLPPRAGVSPTAR